MIFNISGIPYAMEKSGDMKGEESKQMRERKKKEGKKGKKKKKKGKNN